MDQTQTPDPNNPTAPDPNAVPGVLPTAPVSAPTSDNPSDQPAETPSPTAETPVPVPMPDQGTTETPVDTGAGMPPKPTSTA